MRDYSDQSKIFNVDTWGWPVHLIGAGGINNLLGPMLAKMGIQTIHVWDDDILETRNCPTEVAYSYRQVGQPKTAAMQDIIYYLVDDSVRVVQHQARVTTETQLSGIVVCGVDSMKSRQEIWCCVQSNFLEIPLFIDGRSAGEETAIFAFAPCDADNAEAYAEDWLFEDSEAMQLECGARNIAYISGYMATEISRIITRFHRDLPVEFYTHRNFAEIS